MIVLARIDDRLIHGQVVEGWLPVIQTQRIVVVSDAAARDPFQGTLMRIAVPPTVEVTILSVEETVKEMGGRPWVDERVLLLLPGLKEARRLVESGWRPGTINLGGLHDAPGRTVYTPSLALSDADKADIRFLLDKKIVIETRVLPGDERRLVEEYL